MKTLGVEELNHMLSVKGIATDLTSPMLTKASL